MKFDRSSPEWTAHTKDVMEQVAALDAANRAPLDLAQTQFIRGQIKGLLSTLELPERLKPIQFESQGID